MPKVQPVFLRPFIELSDSLQYQLDQYKRPLQQYLEGIYQRQPVYGDMLQDPVTYEQWTRLINAIKNTAPVKSHEQIWKRFLNKLRIQNYLQGALKTWYENEGKYILEMLSYALTSNTDLSPKAVNALEMLHEPDAGISQCAEGSASRLELTQEILLNTHPFTTTLRNLFNTATIDVGRRYQDKRNLEAWEIHFKGRLEKDLREKFNCPPLTREDHYADEIRIHPNAVNEFAKILVLELSPSAFLDTLLSTTGVSEILNHYDDARQACFFLESLPKLGLPDEEINHFLGKFYHYDDDYSYYDKRNLNRDDYPYTNENIFIDLKILLLNYWRDRFWYGTYQSFQLEGNRLVQYATDAGVPMAFVEYENQTISSFESYLKNSEIDIETRFTALTMILGTANFEDILAKIIKYQSIAYLNFIVEYTDHLGKTNDLFSANHTLRYLIDSLSPLHYEILNKLLNIESTVFSELQLPQIKKNALNGTLRGILAKKPINTLIIKTLIEHGASPNTEVSHQPLLCWAITQNDQPLIDTLITHDALCINLDSERSNALHIAIGNNLPLSLIRFLTEKCPTLLSNENTFFRTPIKFAIFKLIENRSIDAATHQKLHQIIPILLSAMAKNSYAKKFPTPITTSQQLREFFDDYAYSWQRRTQAFFGFSESIRSKLSAIHTTFENLREDQSITACIQSLFEHGAPQQYYFEEKFLLRLIFICDQNQIPYQLNIQEETIGFELSNDIPRLAQSIVAIR